MPRPPVLYPIWMLPPRPVHECLGKIAGAGFDGVSFMAAPVDDPRRLDTVSGAEARSVRSALREAGLRRTLHIASDAYFQGQAERSDAAVRQAQASIDTVEE